MKRVIDYAIAHIKWCAQTIHQGHHQEQPYRWQECPRGFCKSNVDALGEVERLRAEEFGEELTWGAVKPDTVQACAWRGHLVAWLVGATNIIPPLPPDNITLADGRIVIRFPDGSIVDMFDPEAMSSEAQWEARR